MHQQLAGPLGGVVELVGEVVFLDIASDKPDFIFEDSSVGFFQGDLAIAQAFYFAAGEHDAAFESIEDEVMVPGFAIVRDGAFVFRVVFGSLFFAAFIGRGLGLLGFAGSEVPGFVGCSCLM